MSARFTWYDAAKQRQGTANQAHRRNHMFLRVAYAAYPQLLVVLPLAQGQLQRGFQTLLNAGLGCHVQDGGGFHLTRRISRRQMVAARGLAQAALTQTRLAHQLTCQFEHVVSAAFQQFKL
ncbi:hypothetical protein D3C71_1866130 [compost metagenome]